MKKLITITMTMMLAASITKAQTTITGWSFPTGTATDANPDQGLPANSAMLITTQGGTSAIDFSKNGATSKSAQATGWDGGTNLKYWQIEVNTSGYQNLKLSSKQTSGGQFPGPRDWKVQYKIGTPDIWADIPNSNVVTANDWLSGVLTDINIPSVCENQSSVFFRWIMTSDTSVATPALVATSGTTKIDDIFITGTPVTGIDEDNNIFSFSVFPIPCYDILSVKMPGSSNGYTYEIYNTECRLTNKGVISGEDKTPGINVSGLKRGVYFIRLSNSNFSSVKRIIVE